MLNISRSVKYRLELLNNILNCGLLHRKLQFKDFLAVSMLNSHFNSVLIYLLTLGNIFIRVLITLFVYCNVFRFHNNLANLTPLYNALKQLLAVILTKTEGVNLLIGKLLACSVCHKIIHGDLVFPYFLK